MRRINKIVPVSGERISIQMPDREIGFGEITEGEQDFLGEEVLRMIKDGTIARKSEESLEFVKKYF